MQKLLDPIPPPQLLPSPIKRGVLEGLGVY
jgi:hypothetical protein